MRYGTNITADRYTNIMSWQCICIFQYCVDNLDLVGGVKYRHLHGTVIGVVFKGIMIFFYIKRDICFWLNITDRRHCHRRCNSNWNLNSKFKSNSNLTSQTHFDVRKA